MKNEQDTEATSNASYAPEIRYRRLFETAQCGILILDGKEGRIYDVNPYLRDMLQYSHEDFLGKKLLEAGPFKETALSQTAFEELRDRGFVRYGDLTLETKEGKRIEVELVGSVYEADDRQMIQCDIWNATERRKVEQGIRQAERKYRDIFENVQEGISRSTPEGRIILANQALARMLGYDTPEELMDGVTDIARQVHVNPEEWTRIKEIIEAQGFVKGYEFQAYRKDGGIVWVSTTRHAVRNPNGQILYYDAIDSDITYPKQCTTRLNECLVATVHAIAQAVELKDQYTAGHHRRSADIACALAREMGLSNEQIDGIHLAAAIHDVGKIALPAEILTKPGLLTDIEYSLIKTHAQIGNDMLRGINFPWPIARIILEHHERMDRSGYPNGLSGDDLLIESKVLSVSDVMESMAFNRPYRISAGLKAALKELTDNRGTLYDSGVVDACLRLFNEKGYRIPN